MSKLAGESESNLRKGLLNFLKSYFDDLMFLKMEATLSNFCLKNDRHILEL